MPIILAQFVFLYGKVDFLHIITRVFDQKFISVSKNFFWSLKRKLLIYYYLFLLENFDLSQDRNTSVHFMFAKYRLPKSYVKIWHVYFYLDIWAGNFSMYVVL